MRTTTIWLLGLSASGKSTLAMEIVKLLENNGEKVQLIDGDLMRDEIGGMFGYSKEERIKMAAIYRTIAKILNKNGINVIVAAITPYEEIRKANRKKIENYIEINVSCPIEECIVRDPKGLYKRALNGEEKSVIGIDEEYEFPENSDIQVNTNIESIEESLEKVTMFLQNNAVFRLN